MIHFIHNQPDDSSYDEILNELAFCLMIEQGLAVPVSTTACSCPSTDLMDHRPFANSPSQMWTESWSFTILIPLPPVPCDTGSVHHRLDHHRSAAQSIPFPCLIINLSWIFIRDFTVNYCFFIVGLYTIPQTTLERNT